MDTSTLAPAEVPSDTLLQQLEVAAQVQRSLLPKRYCCFRGWEVGYEYQPAGFLSADYVDLIPAASGGVHLVLGDVSGKGVGASILMSHLYATFRALLAEGLPLQEVLTKISRVFCEISLPAQFATLVLGTANSDGEVEICNAGHVPVLLVKKDKVVPLNSTAMPVGMFCSQSFTSETIKMDSGDILFLYSDGLTESENANGEQYGEARLTELLYRLREDDLPTLLNKVLQDAGRFAGEQLADDRSFLALRQSA
jgi:sigma-B regulation protein RsbU (phosphoserine phosphatase)